MGHESDEEEEGAGGICIFKRSECSFVLNDSNCRDNWWHAAWPGCSTSILLQPAPAVWFKMLDEEKRRCCCCCCGRKLRLPYGYGEGRYLFAGKSGAIKVFREPQLSDNRVGHVWQQMWETLGSSIFGDKAVIFALFHRRWIWLEKWNVNWIELWVL